MSLEGVILSFVGVKLQNLPFLGRTGNSVPIPKRGVPVPIRQRQSGTGTKILWYLYPFTTKGLVQVSMLLAALIFIPLHS